MSKPPAKTRNWSRPSLAPLPADVRSGRATDLWTQGEKAEAAYDFEVARDRYLAAAHAAQGAESLTLTRRYAEFLVERYGQFPEVAAWLNDPAFEPPMGLAGADAPRLVQLLARAARETGHPRAAELDEALALQGDPDAVARVATQQVQSGRVEQARTLLERFAGLLPPLGPAQRLLEHLRAEEALRGQQALLPVESALATRDVGGARLALETLRADWHAHPAFATADGRVREAEEQGRASALRQRIDEALDANDLGAAHDAVRLLVALDVATDADRNYLTFIAQSRKDVALRERLQQVRAATDHLTRLRALGQLADEHGLDAWPDEDIETAQQWSVVREAAALKNISPLATQAAGLEALLALREALVRGDTETARQRLSGLAPPWTTAPTATRAAIWLRTQDDVRQRAREAEVAEAVARRLEAGELDVAADLLAEWTRQTPQVSPEIKALRAELAAARQVDARRARLQMEVDEAIGRQDWFRARARLGDLGPLLPLAQRTELTRKIDEAAAPTLRGRPLPPGVQKLAQAPLVSGIAHGRLLLVQDRIWIAVNLTTRGLQPYELPKEWPVQANGFARLAQVGEVVRLVGISQYRLVVIEQLAGQPPAVTAAAPLADLLRGDDQLVGAALQPDAATWTLLSRSTQRGPATTWTRVDARTLEVVDQRKSQPSLENLCGIEGMPGPLLVATSARERTRAAWIAALTDGRGEPQHKFAAADLGEQIAGFRAAVAWPAQDRIYASFNVFDPFEPGVLHAGASLLVLRAGRVTFASSDLRKRFAPADRLAVDQPWTLDPAAGRLWFAAVPLEGEGERDACLLGVDARTLRADRPIPLAGIQRIVAIQSVEDGAVLLCRAHGGAWSLMLAQVGESGLSLTPHGLPL